MAKGCLLRRFERFCVLRNYREVSRNLTRNGRNHTPARQRDYIPAQESVSVDASELPLNGHHNCNGPDRQMCHDGDGVTPDECTFHRFMT